MIESGPASTFPASSRRHSGWVNTTAWLLLVIWGTACLAWVLLLVDLEIALKTASLIILLALAGTGCGCVARYPLGSLMMLPHLVTPLLMAALTIAYNWGPREATLHFTRIGAVHILATGPTVLWVWRRRPVAWQPWQCQACGYVLAGIPSNRCPECGTVFDPQAIALCQPADLPRV